MKVSVVALMMLAVPMFFVVSTLRSTIYGF
jgi:hypothetical protein